MPIIEFNSRFTIIYTRNGINIYIYIYIYLTLPNKQIYPFVVVDTQLHEERSSTNSNLNFINLITMKAANQ